MNKHPVLGWPPAFHLEKNLAQVVEEALAEGRPSVVKSAVRSVRAENSQKLRQVRIAVLRSMSLELLENTAILAFARWGVLADFTWLDLNSFEPELLNPQSQLNQAHAQAPFDFVVLGWRLADFLAHPLEGRDPGDIDDLLKKSLARLTQILDASTKIAPTVCLPLDLEGSSLPFADGRLLQSRIALEHQLFLTKYCAAHGQHATVMDLRLDSASFSIKSDAFSKQPFSIAAQVKVCLSLAKACGQWLLPGAKVVVVDADNTLWGGIVGEEGPHGVQINFDYPGNLYLKLQSNLAALKGAGIILAICSKNNERDVLEVFELNKNMRLARRDFSAAYINWQSKAENLKLLARELNLGLSSFVFLDDSEFERAEVRAMCPEVRVPETPSAVEMIDYLENGLDFVMRPQTQEDRARLADYEAQKLRDELQKGAGDSIEFLRSLEITVTMQRWSEETLPRMAQMVLKTNQFNLTTRRHSQSQLQAWMNSGDWQGWVIEARDRFSKQGIIGCAVARRLLDGGWDLDSFLMSCRALGRGIETAFLDLVLQDLTHLGARRVIGRFVPSSKNQQVSEFYLKTGAKEIGLDGTEHLFEFNVENGLNDRRMPEWIGVERV